MSTTAAAAVLAAGMRLVASHDYAEGAPPGFSGGFKEESCHACHFHEPPNSGSGRITIEGVPARFVAGERYALTITLAQAGMKRGGFQLTARFQNGGAQAGALAAAEADTDRVAVATQSDIQYAGQKAAGSSPGAEDSIRWVLEWIAPAGAEAVVFNVASNAANGDGSAEGDFIYTASVESDPPP